jgi:hypothetical protein
MRFGLGLSLGRSSAEPAAAQDVAAPTFVSATIPASGSTISIQLSETVYFGSGGNTGFSLSTAEALTYSSGAGTNTLVYSISPEVELGDTPTLSYSGTGVVDAASNALAAFSDSSIANNSTFEPE